MDIGNAKLAFGLSINLFDDILKGLHAKNVFPKQLEVEQEINIIDKLNATIFLTVDNDPPNFYLDTQTAGEPYTRLEISGRVTPKIAFAGETSPDLFTIEFSAAVRVNIKLRKITGMAPVIFLEYGGAVFMSDPFEKKFIDDIFNKEEVKRAIESVQLDVLKPIIEGLSDVYYFGKPESERPRIDIFPVAMQLQYSNGINAPAITLFIGTPDDPMNKDAFGVSILPGYSEFMMHVGPELIERVKEKGKAKIEEMIKSYSSVNLTNYTLEINNNQVDISARIDESNTGSYANMSGYFHFKHVPGMEVMFMDGSKVKVDVELPWWLDFIAFFVDDLGDAIRYAEQDVPDIMQDTIKVFVNDFMKKLDDSLQLEDLEFEGVPIEVYPQEIVLEDNSITANIQILIQPRTEHLKSASYGKLLDKFIYFELESGRKYYVEDLAKFMQKGLITIPGYHQVGGRYLRANPDSKESNNLERLYGR